MIRFLLSLLLAPALLAQAPAPAGLKLGDPCPPFSLPGTDGKPHGPDMNEGGPPGGFAAFTSPLVLPHLVSGPSPDTRSESTAPALLVVFLSTECPYVLATQARINGYAKQYAGKVAVLAINANDVDAHAKESLADMRAQAKGQGFVFPYLKDEPQAVTRAFGAVCTPDFFLFDGSRKLAYRGRMDDSWRDASKVTARDLEAATEALLAGKPVSPDQTPSRGCSIKWKPAP